MTAHSAPGIARARGNAAIAAVATVGIIERPRAESTIAAGLRNASSGRHSAVIAVGEAGSGKTTFARQIAQLARESGFNSVVAAGHTVAAVPGLIARSVTAQIRGQSDPRWTGSDLIIEACAAVEAGALAGPLALILDDVDRYPIEDLALVEQLLLRPPRGRFFLALVADVERAARHNARLLDVLALLSGDPDRQRIFLEPLSESDTEALTLERLARRSMSRQFLVDLHELTQGNPGRLSSVLRLLQRLDPFEREQLLSGARSLVDLRLPSLLGQERVEGLATLDELDREVLDALATWAATATAAQIAFLVDRAPTHVEASLTALDHRQWVGAQIEAGAVHYALAPALRHHLYSVASASRRHALHRRAATLLEISLEASGAVDGSEHSTKLAKHYVRGGFAMSRSRVRHLVDAGRHHLLTGRYGDAAEVLGCAQLSISPGEDLRGEILVSLSEAYLRLGDADSAERVLTAAPSGLSNDSRAKLIHRLVRIRSASGDAQTAAALVDGALAMGTLTAAVEVDLLGETASLEHDLGQPAEALEHARRGARLAELAVGSARASALLLKVVDIHLTAGRNRDALSEARRSLALARADGSQRAVGRALVGVGMALRQIGEVRRSLRWMERARRAALAAPDRPGEAFVAFQIACTLLELGRWDEALEAALTAIEQDQALHRERALHRSSAIALELAALRVATSHGHLFEDPTRQDTPAGRQSPRDFVATGIAQVVTDLLNGQIEPAMTLLREIEHRLRETPGWEYSLYAEVLPWTGRIASERGDLRELDRLARLYQSPPIDVGEAPVLLGEAALAAARRASGLQRSECASALAEFAASTFEASGYVFRAALARMELALALVHAGESERAADPLKNAYRQLSGIGATREVERLREALHSLNLRAPGPARPRAEDSLTRREDEVARLASRGLTNGQIASELDISARTVGTHMHRILKKLGLRSRHELRYLPDAEPDPIARLR